MASAKTVEVVKDIVRPVIEDMGLRLWDVRFLKEGASHYLRIYIDSDKGIDINNCTDVSHAIDPLIDAADPIDVSYFLEVCSPGINREIKSDEHFLWAQNKAVILRTVRPEENGSKEFFGTLIKRDKESVTLTDAGKEIKFLRSNIQSVKLDDDKELEDKGK